MRFEEREHNFGTMREGEKRTHVFHFSNAGDAELVIEHISGSCGCTVPELGKRRYQPGEKGQISVEYDSTEKEGEQESEVTIILAHADAEGYPIIEELKIRAFVETE